MLLNKVSRGSMLTALLVMLVTTSFAKPLIPPKMPMNKILRQFTLYAGQVKDQWQVPGMAIAIVHNGKIVYKHGFGIRDDKDVPVNADTIFDIASLTKSFTAVLLAMQIDEGKYKWNTKVVDLLPNFKLYDADLTNKFEVRDLIAHDSGLPGAALNALGNFGYSVEHNMNAVRYIKPVAPFRSTFAYQNIFLEFARQIIEKYSGKPFSKVINERIFDPLEMKDSFISTETAFSKQKNVAQPFLFYKGKNYPYSRNSPYLTKQWALGVDVASGGMRSSAADMAKWLLFNMGNGKVGHTSLLSQKNLDFIHTPQTIIQKSKNGIIEQAYGEGWFIDKQAYPPYTVLYHPGGGTGMHAFMAYIPQTKTGIVILTNQYTNKAPMALYKRLFDLYFGVKPLKDWSKIFLDARNKTKLSSSTASTTCQKKSNQSISEYAGTYYNPVYGKIVITEHGHTLIMPIGPQGIKWYLTFCQKGIFKAFWPNQNGMNVPMLSNDDDLVYFLYGKNHKVTKMKVPFLNSDGSGIFLKQH
ncbi:MAG: serine hydrolase [Pseudomonadota bacterium]